MVVAKNMLWEEENAWLTGSRIRLFCGSYVRRKFFCFKTRRWCIMLQVLAHGIWHWTLGNPFRVQAEVKTSYMNSRYLPSRNGGKNLPQHQISKKKLYNSRISHFRETCFSLCFYKANLVDKKRVVSACWAIFLAHFH